jgi:hypothetical protein
VVGPLFLVLERNKSFLGIFLPGPQKRGTGGTQFHLLWVGNTGGGLIRNKNGRGSDPAVDEKPLWSPIHRAKKRTMDGALGHF